MKTLGAAALALALALSLAACGSKPQGDGALTDVTLCLDWTPNTNHTGFYVAAAQGYFEEAGLNVSIVQPLEDSATAMCAAGQTEFAITVQDNLAAAFARENPLAVTPGRKRGWTGPRAWRGTAIPPITASLSWPS